MSSSKLKLKEIKAIVRDFDVRDPKGAMIAIEGVINAEISGTKKQKPVFKVEVFDQGEVIKVDVGGRRTAKPKHVKCAVKAIKQFIAEKQMDCDCPACQAERAAKTGEPAVQPGDGSKLGELLASLRASGLNPIVFDTTDKDAK